MLPRFRRDGRSKGCANTPCYGRSASGLTGSVTGGDQLAEAVVDVEEARQGPAGVQPEQPEQPPPAEIAGVADGVVVEAPGQTDPSRSAGQIADERGRDAGEQGGQCAQLPAEGVLHSLPVPPGGRPRLGRSRG